MKHLALSIISLGLVAVFATVTLDFWKEQDWYRVVGGIIATAFFVWCTVALFGKYRRGDPDYL